MYISELLDFNALEYTSNWCLPMNSDSKKVMFAVMSVFVMVVAAAAPLASVLSERGSMYDYSNDYDTGSSVTIDGLTISQGRDRVADAESPINQEDFVFNWEFAVDYNAATDWTKVPSTGIVVGDSYFVRAYDAIYKIDIKTGSILKSAPSNIANYLYGHWTDHADIDGGLIIDNPNKTVYDLNLKPLYKLQYAWKTVLHEGYLYSLTSTGLYKYDPAVGDLRSSDVKTPIWSSPISSERQLYPIFIGNYAYAAVGTSSTGVSIVAFDLTNGSIKETRLATAGVGLNNEITYDNGKIYFTTYGKGIFDIDGENGTIVSVPVNTATGEMDVNGTSTLPLTGAGNNTSLVLHNGYGYVYTDGGFHVIDLATFTEVAYIDGGTRLSRGNMALSYHYATPENGNKVYLYIVDYVDNQRFIIYSHAYIGGEHIVEKNYITDLGRKEFCTETINFGPNGEIIWHNDSAVLFCYVNGAALGESLSGDVNMDGSVNLEDAVNIAKYVLGSVSLSNIQLGIADHNGDGTVDMRDAISIIRYVNKSFPVMFNILDEDGYEVIGVDVKVYSNVDMTFEVRERILPAGTYYYVMECFGYNIETGSFEIVDEAVTVNVVMAGSNSDSMFVVENGKIVDYTGPNGSVIIPSEINGVTITGIGANAFANAEIRSVIIPDSVISIEASAFFASTVQSVSIGKGVTSIAANAFGNTNKLIAITVDKDNRFYSSLSGVLYNKAKTATVVIPTNVVNVIIPGTMKTVGGFSNLPVLETVMLEYGVTTISANAFSGCPNLRDVSIPASVTSIGANFINGSAVTRIVVPHGITTIAANVFNNCASLETVILPESVTTISSNAFLGCTSLKYMQLPSNLRSMSGSSGLSVSVIETLVLHADMSTFTNASVNSAAIKYLAFGKLPTAVTILGGANLEQVTILNGATLVNIQNFSKNWTNLKVYSVSSDSPLFSVVDGVLFSKDGKTLISFPAGKDVETYVVPEGVTHVSKSAFINNKHLKTVVMPSTLAEVGDEAFFGSQSLGSIVFTGTSVKLGTNSVHTSAGNQIDVFADSGFTWTGSTPSMDRDTYEVAFIADGIVLEYAISDGTIYLDAYSIRNGSHVWAGSDGNTYLSTDVVTLTGDMTFSVGVVGVDLQGNVMKYLSSKKDVVIPSSLGTMAITGILDTAFKGNTSITSVEIPGSITTMSSGVFQNCSGLLTVTFGSGFKTIGVSMFEGCTNLTAVDIPDSVTSIGNRAFYNNNKVTTLSIGSGLSSIGTSAFYQFTSLESIIVSAENSNFKVLNEALMSSNLSTLYLYPSKGVSTSWTSPAELRTIQASAFRNNTVLKEITLAPGITAIGGDAFMYATALESVIISDTVRSIGSYAFANCTSLTSVVIPNTVTSIGANAFDYCTSLTSIVIPGSVLSIGNNAFSNCALIEVHLNEGTATIGNNAFRFNPTLTYINIPSSVVSIGTGAFLHNTFDTNLHMFFEGSTIPTLPGSGNTLGALKVYYHGSYNVDDFNWGIAGTITKGTFWYVMFDVDGVETKMIVPAGATDLTPYVFTDANDDPVTEWIIQGSETEIAANGTLTVNADMVLVAKGA